MPRKVMIPVLVAIISVVAFSSCAKKEGEKLQVNQGLAARIGDFKMTAKEVDDRFENLPPALKNKYKGRSGRAQFVDDIISDELVYMAANETDLKYDEDVKKQLRAAEKNIMIAAYLKKYIKEKIEISDDEIEKYYNEHILDFMNKAVMKVQHIWSENDSMKVVSWKERIEKGEDFDRIASTECEDPMTAVANGNLGYFNPGGYVRFYGDDPSFSEQVQDLEIGEISDVVVTDRGYSLIRVTDKKGETPKPLSEVRGIILETLRGEKAMEKTETELVALNKKYKPVNFLREEIAETSRSAEELWEMAQEEDAYYTRILYYRHLVNKYPDHKYAPQALFMIGFVYAEEAMDLVQARRTFEELLKTYPDSEVAESARWMIENMKKPHPKFESVDEMKKKMEEDGEEQD